MITNYKIGKNSLVKAVCGSGKTEICFGIISYCIRRGLTVGFAVPRTNVCIELYGRFAWVFKENKVIAVYGGHHNILNGDLIVLTTHQLFRYENYFDLLIMDEIDAFPFKGDDVLEAMFINSLRGNFILMSATPNEQTINNLENNGGEVIELYSRFHKHPLPVPNVIKGNIMYLNYNLIKYLSKFIKQNKPVFIFVPIIDLSFSLFMFLRLFFHHGNYVNSKRENRNQIIEDFRNKKYDYLVTTAVLERGVTVKDLQVIVYKADHKIYDSFSLIQIAGRVGRKMDAPEGEVIFLARHINDEIKKAVGEINSANEKLQNMLQNNKRK